MLALFKRNPLAVILAVALHALLAVMLLLEWQDKPDKPKAAATRKETS